MAADVQKLPACERCRQRKVKCDGDAPKCSSCQKSSSACIIIDPVSHERISRGAIAELEQSIKELEHEIAVRQATSPASITSSIQPATGIDHNFVGEGSGLNLYRNVSRQTPRQVQADLIDANNVLSPGSECKAHRLPSFDIAQAIMQRYFSTSHLHHPIISREVVYPTLDRVYQKSHEVATDQDHYTIFMLLAVGSVTMYRRGQINAHPYGYFYAAQRFMPKVQLVGTIPAIQNLILFARFAMYYHVNYSIWDITRNCMRQCIELGLHRKPRSRLDPLEEQSRRNIFWNTYVHDRYSSGILGRPYAISEEEIEVALPLEASERDILISRANCLDEIDLHYIQRPNETSISLFVIGLRRITTRVHKRFFSATNSTSQTITNAGQVLSDMEDLADEYDKWLAAAPQFDDPKSLYQRREWHQFLTEKDKLFLYRGALARAPIAGLSPPRHLVSRCLSCATTVIELYNHLYRQNHITWTRSYFQIIFTCGLSIVYALSFLQASVGDSLNKPSPTSTLESGQKALATAKDLLDLLVREMPDVERFALVFARLSEQHVTGTSSRALSEVVPGVGQTVPDTYAGLEIGIDAAQTAVPYQHYQADTTAAATDMTLMEDHDRLAAQPVISSLHASQVPSIDLNFDLEMGDLQYWPSYMQDNMFGQLEAGLGEYAWGHVADGGAWDQFLPQFH